MDSLELFTGVQVKGRRGVVVKVEEKKDQHGGPIMVRTIRFTHKSKIVWGGKSEWIILAKQKEEEVNYSFIQILPHAGYQG